jgi:ArsR family transcriptional regulator, arsenate/arsenite/antimonite-responsive transcriptional repressor
MTRCFDTRQPRTMPKQTGAAAEVTSWAPLGTEPLGKRQADQVARVLKALADPVRLRLLSMIAAVDEVPVFELQAPFGLSGPTISHHLKVLRAAGLVDDPRRGTRVYYRAEPAMLDAIGALFTLT